MNKIRFVFFLLLIAVSTVMVIALIKEKPKTPLESTWVPLYQIIGNVPKSVSHSMMKIIPIDEIDEKEYGEAISLKYETSWVIDKPASRYVNEVLSVLSKLKKKGFTYHAFVIDYPLPNAFAMPGGVICVTDKLLNMLESETELAAILAHEMGHIENSHCLNIVKYELLMKKIGQETIGELVDIATVILLRHSFSKTEENEADDYAFKLLLNTSYDPAGLYQAFQKLLNFEKKISAPLQRADLIRDYFLSHPPTELRMNKYQSEAMRWWKQNKNSEKRYVGKRNYMERVSIKKHVYNQEWISSRT